MICRKVCFSGSSGRIKERRFNMYITKELLIEKSACKEGLDWFNKNFPSGCELNDETIAKISDRNTDFIWWFYENIQQDKRLYKLCGVNESDGVHRSNGVNWSYGVNESYGVNGSDGVNRSDGVNLSNGVNGSDGVNRSNGVNRSFGILKCYGVNNAIFLANQPIRYSVFGIDVNQERFYEVENKLFKSLSNWKPTFNNAQKIYLASGSNWKKVTAEHIVKISKEEAWAEMPQEAVDYVKSLEEYNADMFFEITGLK